MKVNELKASSETVKALRDMGFETLTPIQEQAIPVSMSGLDVIGQSQTGTGKTAAFGIPIIEKVDPSNKKPQAIILCPTRELAVQVGDEIRRIAKHKKGVKVVPVYGGEPIYKQIAALKRGAQIIVGTPGRTMDHIFKRHTLKTGDISMVVLDEADEMLKMGFREDIELVLGAIPEERQTTLFSATMPKAILDLTHKYQNKPEFIKVKTKVVTADTITQEYCEVRKKDKQEALQRFLSYYEPKRCLVFCNTKRNVDRITDDLKSKGVRAEKIHGDLKQEHRMAVLKQFNKAKVHVLIGTDVAGRGLDIQNVDLVVNYDAPDKADFYVHRIGRTGRAGNEGRAITLVSEGDKRLMKDIVRYTKQELQKVKIPTVHQINKMIKSQFVDEIQDLVKHKNLDDYLTLVDQLEAVDDLRVVCAALIKKGIELETEYDFEDINYKVKDRGSSRGGSRGKQPRSKGKKKSFKDKEATRFYLNVGRHQDVTPRHILGAIAGECNIPGKKIGSIDIFENYTFVDVHESVAKKVLKKFNGKRINGKKISLEIAR